MIEAFTAMQQAEQQQTLQQQQQPSAPRPAAAQPDGQGQPPQMAEATPAQPRGGADMAQFGQAAINAAQNMAGPMGGGGLLGQMLQPGMRMPQFAPRQQGPDPAEIQQATSAVATHMGQEASQVVVEGIAPHIEDLDKRELSQVLDDYADRLVEAASQEDPEAAVDTLDDAREQLIGALHEAFGDEVLGENEDGEVTAAALIDELDEALKAPVNQLREAFQPLIDYDPDHPAPGPPPTLEFGPPPEATQGALPQQQTPSAGPVDTGATSASATQQQDPGGLVDELA